MAEVKIENAWYAYHKGYDSRKGFDVLCGVTADIHPGIHLLLGPNGVGKTTLMRMIAGMIRPQSGLALVDSIDISQRTPDGLQRVFYLPEDSKFPLSTINEMVKRHAPFYPNFSMERLEANLREFGIGPADNLEAMSLGWRKKANIAYALSLNTDVLLLDEPTNGLDIEAKQSLNKVVAANCDEGKVIIVATHTVHEMQALFDGVMLIHDGTLRLTADVYDLGNRYAFVTSPHPIPEALYSEPTMAGFRCLIPNDGTIESQVDFVLLYQAVLSGVKI